MIERGLVRFYWAAVDGRQATLAFLGASELLGGTSILGDPPQGGSAQVVVDSNLNLLNLQIARQLGADDLQISNAIGLHLAAQVRNAFKLVAVRTLGNIAERLAYDLLDRACQCQLATGQLEVRSTHANLADSIGSSREVVSRALGEFRRVGIIETVPGVVRVIRPARLAKTVHAFSV